MSKNTDPYTHNRHCADWSEIAECLGAFDPPATGIDSDGDATSQAWVFRGLRRSSYELQPAIEREAESKEMPWSALEVFVSKEFRSRAYMHLSAPLIPHDELTWLALMQHYAIPTRLLDFTYSPFVALYFAIRDGQNRRRKDDVRVWAINADAVNRRFKTVVRSAKGKAVKKEQSRKGTTPEVKLFDFWDLDNYYTSRDSMISETQGLQTLITEALAATGAQRREQTQQGCVCIASPPIFNQRLASQQGVFLLNCTEKLSFDESLHKMMKQRSDWFRTFDISAAAIPEIEARLFQFNIHEQTLFPDMEGLAGMIKQKTRLHWRRPSNPLE